MKKNKKWIAPLIIAAVIVIAAIIIGMKVYDMMFNGGVQVAMSDVYTHLQLCAVPIALIVIAIVAAVIVSIAVHKAEENRRSLIRWNSFFAVVLVIAVCLNWVGLGKEYSLLNSVLNGSQGMSEETKADGIALSQEIVEEGIVLLKNDDNALPLSTDKKLNVFGWGSVFPIYGGTGSGSISVEDSVSLLDGLEAAGFEVNQDLVDFYTNYETVTTEIKGDDFGFGADWTVQQPTVEMYDEQGLFESAKEYSDTAVVVISRGGGEGTDLPAYLGEEYNNDACQVTSNPDDYDSEKSYLELSNREIAMMDRINELFDNVVVIINSNNAMELGFLEQYDCIKAALLCSGPGAYGFTGLGTILSGEANPSGRLVDTYVYDLHATPTINNVGNFTYSNYEEASKTADEKVHFVNYVENIYVGYKYYETAAVEGKIDYDSTVQFPFGYGLSYTTFSQEISSFNTDGNTITLEVTVTNTGDTAGKEVVELYYNPPYYNGGIEKASTNLLDYEKTSLLDPGASETVSFTVNYEDMASYDTYGNGCYVLEHGDYTLSINSDSHNVIDSETITVDKDIIYNDENDGKRSTDAVTAENQFADFTESSITYLSRKDGFANYDEATAAPSDVMTQDQIDGFYCTNTYDAADYDDPNAEMPVTGASNGLTLSDMVGLDYNDEKWDELLDQMTPQDMENLIGNGGFAMVAIDSIGSPAIVESDGPAGLSSNFNESKNGIGYPCGVVIASTWNKELAYKRGQQVGIQGKEVGVTGWYGPAMNIHRSAFAGRNFEYYSEDGTLSGIVGANEVKGATEQGMICYIKHFALNDQESNRGSICTWATEQSIREIYLKAFESAVKESKTLGVMNSFALPGGQWSGSCVALIQNVLVGEWGFRGCVISDAWAWPFEMEADRGVRTGTTKFLGMWTMDSYFSDLESTGTVTAMREACHMNLYALANSAAMEAETGTPTWVILLYAADALIVLALIISELIIIRLYGKKKTKVEVTKE